MYEPADLVIGSEKARRTGCSCESLNSCHEADRSSIGDRDS